MHHPQHLQVVSLGKCQISDGLQKGTLSHSRETYQGWVLPVSPKTCQEQGPRERHVWGKTHMIYRKLCVLKSCCCLKPGLNLAKFFSRCIVEWLACGSAVGFTCCASSVLWNAYHIIYLRDPYEGEKRFLGRTLWWRVLRLNSLDHHPYWRFQTFLNSDTKPLRTFFCG